MFLHLGEDVVIPLKNVIAIIDIESSTISTDTRKFLAIAEEEGFVESISLNIPKSFIIAEIDEKSKLYLSPISSVTLQKRAGFINRISNI